MLDSLPRSRRSEQVINILLGQFKCIRRSFITNAKNQTKSYHFITKVPSSQLPISFFVAKGHISSYVMHTLSIFLLPTPSK